MYAHWHLLLAFELWGEITSWLETNLQKTIVLTSQTKKKLQTETARNGASFTLPSKG